MKKVLSLILCLSMLIVASPAINSTIFILGDANHDGNINARDALLLRKVIAGIENEISDEGDIDRDGEYTFSDLLTLRQYFVGNVVMEQPDPYIDEINICGVSIDDYVIVIPADADLFTVYAAELLNDFVEDKTNRSIDIVTDDTAETEYEILIGETNRAESADALNAVTLDDDEYLLKQDGSKIVLLGNSYMIGAGVGAFTYDHVVYDSSLTLQTCNINDLPTSDTASAYSPRAAKNAILMIGDGMGPHHPEYTLYYNGLTQWEADYDEFSAERLPNFCTCTTYSLTTLDSNGQTATDSAAAGTALSSGYKTYNKRLGIDENYMSRQNIRELAASLGKRNAVISTEKKEGATPAAFTVHFPLRTEYTAIASIQSSITDCDRLKGDVLDGLLEETKYTLDLLSTNNDSGFFAMIEEAHIDKACHNNKKRDLLHAMARLNTAVRYAMVFAAAHPDTLLIITADHECGGLEIATNNIRFTSDDHTGVDVNVYSIGNGSENFTGTIDNTYIPKVIASQWGVSNFGN